MNNTDAALSKLRDQSPYAYVGDQDESYAQKIRYITDVANQADPQYDWAEFGVENGTSAGNLMVSLPEERRFYLFDSFLGLPEEWVICPEEDSEALMERTMLGGNYPVGSFQALEPFICNDPRVVVVEGWFADTLPVWAASYTGEQLGLMHIDCDLYSSSKTVYENIGHLIKPGTIILFDELTKFHDRKAFREFMLTRTYDFEYIAAVRGSLHVAVRIV